MRARPGERAIGSPVRDITITARGGGGESTPNPGTTACTHTIPTETRFHDEARRTIYDFEKYTSKRSSCVDDTKKKKNKFNK